METPMSPVLRGTFKGHYKVIWSCVKNTVSQHVPKILIAGEECRDREQTEYLPGSQLALCVWTMIFISMFYGWYVSLHCDPESCHDCHHLLLPSSCLSMTTVRLAAQSSSLVCSNLWCHDRCVWGVHSPIFTKRTNNED